MNEILSRQTLANGMELVVFDHSRKVAGDRWLVRLVWQAGVPAAAEFFHSLEGEDPAFLGFLREKIGSALTFTQARERNFVAGAEKAALVEEMLRQGLANMLSYLDTPGFPERLFRRRCQEEKQAWLTARHYEQAADGGEDDGPADFSSCFRDK